LLDTLPAREFRAGYAEVAKYGLINDAAFFAWLESNWREIFSGGPAREHAVAVSCRAKALTVARDERETGERALLNLGHTFGHAFEAAAGFSDRLLHGEAISLGMICAFDFSVRRGLARSADGSDQPGQEGQAREADLHPGSRRWRRLHRVRRRGCRGAIVHSRKARRAMLTEDWISLAVIVVCLVLSFFFSGSETALTAFSRARMLQLEKNGNARARLVNRLVETRERMIGAILAGNNVANIAASALT